MPRIRLSGVITANDLLGGHVVYFTDRQDWSRSIADAVVYKPDDSLFAIELSQSQSHIVVGPYWAEVELDAENIPLPVHFREVFRSIGFVAPEAPSRSESKDKTNVSL